QVADEVLIVARLEETRLNKLDQLDDLLSQSGVTRIGVVLIGQSPSSGFQYYYTPRGAMPAKSSGRASLRAEDPSHEPTDGERSGSPQAGRERPRA
ncbi:MAG: hypothetical protein WAK93_06930, partial [Solirubrobacteraceae bacterium]